MRILIVDDSEIARAVLRRELESRGHVVLECADGHEALRRMQSEPIRLVITDWVMPGMDGLELCRRIRTGDFGGYVYVILLTSKSDRSDMIAGLSAGADEFLAKPFQPDELHVRIRTAERILALETREVAIFALAKLAESRDTETGQHLERMRRYARVLAEQIVQSQAYGDVEHDFVRLVYLTSPLHDIGKVGIPDSVLLKPGRLSDREFAIMKTHAAIGAATLEAAEREFPEVAYLRMAKEIALTHHERFDGTGYPCGLVGEQIPLSGRVVALADVYDALTSKRVYKPAFAHDVARGIILDDSGKHFDPRIVEAFVEREAEFQAIRAEFAESIVALVDCPVGIS